MKNIALAIALLLFIGIGVVQAQDESVNVAMKHNREGAELLSQGNMDDALEEFQKAVELNPKDPVAQRNVAYVLDRQGKVEEAIDAYKQAIELDPKNLLAYNNLGVLYDKEGKYDEAIWQLENALSVNPSDPTTLKNLENAKKSKAVMQERENQLAALRREVDIQPENALALYKLGRLYAFFDRKEEALEWLGKALEHGYDDEHNLKTDPALDKLREDARFMDLLSKYQ